MAELSQKVQKIITAVEELTVLELADLVHALEDKFGVSASAPVMVAGAAPAAAVVTDSAPVEEKTEFNVVLSSTGSNKIAVIKAVRELIPSLGLAEAKTLVESAPKVILEGVNKEKAEEAKKKLTDAGATVEVK